MIKIESRGSFWLIDEEAKKYLRMPKTESPREPGWWIDPQPGDMLYDLEWHEYDRWEMVTDPEFTIWSDYRLCTVAKEDLPRLFIYTADGSWLTAPNAHVAAALRS